MVDQIHYQLLNDPPLIHSGKPSFALVVASQRVDDQRAFNAEIAQERADAAHNAAVREIAVS